MVGCPEGGVYVGATVGGIVTEGEAVDGEPVNGDADGMNVGDADGTRVGEGLGFVEANVGTVDGCIEGCVVGCPVGRVQRGYILRQAALHVDVLYEFAANVENTGLVAESKVNELSAFELITYDRPAAGAGP